MPSQHKVRALIDEAYNKSHFWFNLDACAPESEHVRNIRMSIDYAIRVAVGTTYAYLVSDVIPGDILELMYRISMSTLNVTAKASRATLSEFLGHFKPKSVPFLRWWFDHEALVKDLEASGIELNNDLQAINIISCVGKDERFKRVCEDLDNDSEKSKTVIHGKLLVRSTNIGELSHHTLASANAAFSQPPDPNRPSPNNQNSQEHCYQFSRGRCSWGEKCNRIHDPSKAPPDLPNKGKGGKGRGSRG